MTLGNVRALVVQTLMTYSRDRGPPSRFGQDKGSELTLTRQRAQHSQRYQK
jgi:hypothetical protein